MGGTHETGSATIAARTTDISPYLRKPYESTILTLRVLLYTSESIRGS